LLTVFLLISWIDENNNNNIILPFMVGRSRSLAENGDKAGHVVPLKNVKRWLRRRTVEGPERSSHGVHQRVWRVL
jgi:hypothetical protein